MATKKKSIKELARAAASQGAPQRKKTRKKTAPKSAPSRKKASSSDPLKKLSEAASVVKRAKRMIEDAECGSRSPTRRR